MPSITNAVLIEHCQLCAIKGFAKGYRMPVLPSTTLLVPTRDVFASGWKPLERRNGGGRGKRHGLEWMAWPARGREVSFGGGVVPRSVPRTLGAWWVGLLDMQA